ncbi:hypothetical protein BH09PSE3_BH09PSE3_12800 [soil metagenome]
MIGLALMLAVATPVPEASGVEGADIVVLARKLRALRISLSASKKNGVFAAQSCKVIKSTEDAEIDAIGCAAPAHCSTPGFPTQALFVDCIKTWGHEQIVTLAERRSLARDGQ